MILKAASGVEGMTSLVEQGKKLFGNLAADFTSVHPELRDLVMNVAVANGGDEGEFPRFQGCAMLWDESLLWGLSAEFAAVQKIYRDNDHAETRSKCLVALGRTKVQQLVPRCLDWSFNSGEVRGQDILYILMSFAANRS